MNNINEFFGRKIVIHAPATIANLVCGFDVLGVALNEPYDIMEVTLSRERGLRITHVDDYNLPLIPDKNVAGVSLLAMMEELDQQFGFDITIEKRIKPGSGLGSSAASAAGIVVAVNHLLNNRFSNNDIVRFAMAGEKLASGVKHADNISPCILGGITLIRSAFPLDIISLPFPELYITVVHPQIEVKTSDARDILRKEVLLKDAIKQWGNIAGLVAGLVSKDYDLIARSLVDVIIEPVRSMLIPEFNKIKSECIAAGAIGGGIAGSGPSVFMFSKDIVTARSVETIIKIIYERVGLAYYTYVTTINPLGVKIVSRNFKPS